MTQPRSTRLVRIAATVLGLTLVLMGSACGSPSHRSDATADVEATGSPVTPAAPVIAPVTAPIAKAHQSARPQLPLVIAGSKGGSSPDGSGCATGAASVLPDGTWFGRIVATLPADGRLEFDLECFYSGAAANNVSAAAAGEVPVPNDVYITNSSPATRAVPIASDATTLTLKDHGQSVEFDQVSGRTAMLASLGALGDPALVWLVVKGGEVTVAQQQFLP